MYPEIIPLIHNYIQQNSAAAHLRRRDDVMYTNGVTLRDIASHVKKELIISVTKDTIHRFLKPNRIGTTASKRFKSYIDARVPPKRNSGEKKVHSDFHYTCSQINLTQEMAALCSTGTVALSVDNKNKIEIGNPAANRRSQIRSFYLVEEAPNYNDHDFPYRNSRLTPAGYLRLTRKYSRSRSFSPAKSHNLKTRQRALSESSNVMYNIKKSVSLTSDKLKREKIYWPRSGPLNVRIYPARAIESTNVMHVNFLITFLSEIRRSEEVYNLVAIADGGPDWAVKGVINFMSLGNLWENLKLDVLILQSYAPGHSRFNPIERSWSQLTKWLVGVVLPPDIDGTVPKDTDAERWNKVLDNAVQLCSKFWHGKSYAGFRIAIETFLTSNPIISHLKTTHNLLHTFTNAGSKKISESPELSILQKKYQFFVQHANRKGYQIEFVRCEENSCHHCSSLPKRKNEMLEAMKLFGGTSPAPEQSIFHPGHYRTFLDLLQSAMFQNREGKEVRKVMNNCTENGLCPMGCSYVFFSKADKKRHMILMGHPPEKKKK